MARDVLNWPMARDESGDSEGIGATGVTIDRLAQVSGMSTRNIRANQARGLLPAPEVRGRTGYYMQEHFDRIRLILDLQGEGLSLSGIKRTLDNLPQGAASQVMRLRGSLLEPWDDEQPAIITLEELTERFGIEDLQSIEKAIKMGVLVDLGEGSYEVPVPSLLDVAAEIVALGVSLPAALAVQEKLTRSTDSIAKVFVELFERELLKQFEVSEHSQDDWEVLQATVQAVRPLAARAALSNLRLSMTKAIEKAMTEDFPLHLQSMQGQGSEKPGRRKSTSKR